MLVCSNSILLNKITTNTGDSIVKHHTLHNLARENIELDVSYDYHDEIHNMLNEKFGSRVLENVNDENTNQWRERMNEQTENYFKLLKDVEQKL